MRRFAFSVAAVSLLLTAGATPTHAFLDDIGKLKDELQVYQSAQAADFSEIVSKLDDLGGQSFQDVTEDDWYYTYVASAAGWGIVNGYKDANGESTGVFGPGNKVTVAEALKMIARAARIDETQCQESVPFAQAQTHWAKQFVACALEKHARLFQASTPPDLNRPATRAEVLGLMDDMFGDQEPPLFAPFSDTRGDKYETAIAYAVARGIVEGDRDKAGNLTGTFRPGDPVVRAEVAKMVYSRLKVQVKADGSI